MERKKKEKNLVIEGLRAMKRKVLGEENREKRRELREMERKRKVLGEESREMEMERRELREGETRKIAFFRRKKDLVYFLLSLYEMSSRYRSRGVLGSGGKSSDKKLVRLQEPTTEPLDGFTFVPLNNEKWESILGQFPATGAYTEWEILMPMSTLPDIRFSAFDFGTISKQTRDQLILEINKRKLVLPKQVSTKAEIVNWMTSNQQLFR